MSTSPAPPRLVRNPNHHGLVRPLLRRYLVAGMGKSPHLFLRLRWNASLSGDFAFLVRGPSTPLQIVSATGHPHQPATRRPLRVDADVRWQTLSGEGWRDPAPETRSHRTMKHSTRSRKNKWGVLPIPATECRRSNGPTSSTYDWDSAPNAEALAMRHNENRHDFILYE